MLLGGNRDNGLEGRVSHNRKFALQRPEKKKETISSFHTPRGRPSPIPVVEITERKGEPDLPNPRTVNIGETFKGGGRRTNLY